MRKLIAILLIICSCSPASEPIKYGTDECKLCNMLIMDSRFGSEAVTKKGKVFKFDSIECLVHYYLSDNISESEISMLLITSYTNPNILINAYDGFYLISKSMPSPMGEFLNGFSSKEDAIKFQVEQGGDIYNWEELLNYFKVNR
ncbi:MAG TPA: nitrous oxide reductase accessory protein NosL [Bacteroidia bacterium]|nr:nitrous oxide reductase accessory protein NosL [Bacteroidia bacterium]HNT80816.1 nitrous oxide reductase accessory protein NosL [Bacteroidia bacterium]